MYRPMKPLATNDDLLAGNRVFAGMVEFFPIDADASLLPQWEVIEVDPVLEQQFVFGGDRQTVDCVGGFVDAASLLPQQPVAVSVQGIPVSVLIPPTKIIHDVLN